MSTFNVLRYSALGAGLVYGAVHRYNLESAVKEQHKAEEWKKQEKLIKKAKAEYARLHAPKEQPSTGASLSLKTLEDPNVDFGKVFESLIQKPPYTKEEYQEREKEIVGYENWQVDDDVTHCPLCFVKFNMLIRKHHCRLCGTIVSDIAINSNDPSSMCSLQVPAGIFLELLPNLNYPPHISNNWDALVSINPASTRHAELFSFRCCRECKNTLLPKHNRDDTDETSALFATYNELLMLKAHISTAMPRYESLVSSNLDRQNEQINRLRAKLMKHLKDFETAIANLKQKSFRLDPNTKKHVPLMHPTLVTNIYKSTIVFLQDSLLHFKKINDEFQEMEKSRLTGQLGQLDTSSADEQSALSPEAASPSPAPPKPRLTKKQIRELREELMVVSEQQYLVNQQIAEAKKRRRFDEISALSENVSELEKRKSELENELGEFGFE
ncbi:hypothetical protein CXQ85_004378 [Candidozyma haemuli]|uniref:FYVE-type domain-containing protein n=1 Tax=Candidozyma haemuli TaxID=45357 RepID=A0A2V1ASR7_9ASCO|nr:hypothetical protein CXQ85_004378 [[Candida] haemuloni]PVH20868.1 hypothetical protein CXQ85_004378 [[Candida] haemuloni]